MDLQKIANAMNDLYQTARLAPVPAARHELVTKAVQDITDELNKYAESLKPVEAKAEVKGE
jgi:hypothetical protein